MTLRTGTVLVLLGFAVTIAYQLSSRLSNEALNVALGVLCGIAASVPVSLGLLVALTRKRERADDAALSDESPPIPRHAPRPTPPPQVIVIAPPNPAFGNGQPYPLSGAAAFHNYWPPQAEEVVESRDWKIIGDDVS